MFVCLSGETLLSPLVMCVCVFVRRDTAESVGDVCVCVFVRRDTAEPAGDVCLCVCQERHY